jgi:MFS family permease
MLMSIAVGTVGYLLFGLAHSLVWLFVARMLAGLGAANIATAQAIIADSTTAENRAKGMGLIGAAFGLGFIFGPAIGGSCVQFGLPVPAFVAAGLGALNWISALLYLPETKRVGDAAKGPVTHHRPGLSLALLRHAARHANVPQLFFVYLVFTSAFSMMEQVLGLFIERMWLHGPHAFVAEDPAKKAAALTTWFLVVVGVTATIVQGGLIGRLARHFGERNLLRTGMLLVAAGLLTIPFAGSTGSFGIMLFCASLMAVGTGITNPSLVSLLSQAVDRDEQGATLGIGQSLSALGRIIGPSIAGLLFQMDPNMPFWVAATLTLVAGGIALSIRRVPALRAAGAY